MRVVSLVPSLTETALALAGEGVEVVGRTAWCIHPKGIVEAIPVVGGTKNASLPKILETAPDLVLFEKEENAKELHDAVVDAGLSIFVAHVVSVGDVPSLLEELGAVLRNADEGLRRAEELRELLRDSSAGTGPRVVPLIWHEPLMALSPRRYGGDLLRRAGMEVVEWPEESGGYPTVDAGAIGEAGTEILLLTSEPHDFTQKQGEAIADRVAAAGYDRPLALKVDGEALTWFGVRTADSLRSFRRLAEELAP